MAKMSPTRNSIHGRTGVPIGIPLVGRMGGLTGGVMGGVTATVLAATLSVAGCAPDRGPDRAWSTRGQSIPDSVGRDTIEVQRGGAVRDAALTLLLHASESDSALLRAHAIESMAAAPAEARLPIQRGLGDGNRGVRFVATMSVGIMQLDDLSPLLEPLLQDEAPSVRAATILSLHRTGRNVDPSPLAAMIRSDSPEVRGNAAMVLGELGNPSAIPVLQAALGRGMTLVNPATVRIVELQIAEAQVKLGHAPAIEPIRAALFLPPAQAELVALAAQICGRLGDRSSIPFLRQLVGADGLDRRPPEIRLAAAAALGAMGETTSELLGDVVAMSEDSDPARRAQAAATLGALGDRRALARASQLLTDADPLVQVAAAGAVLRLTD